MPHKLNIIRTIKPEKNIIEKFSESPVGFWEVTTEGDCEGRSITNLGIHYGHVAEIALSLKCNGYSLCFKPSRDPGTSGNMINRHSLKQIVTKKTNISFYGLGNKDESMIEKWLDCPEIKLSVCNYYGAYTIELLESN